MIVTADPLGDYNATSQILRYSALAREITIPRIPSIAHATAPTVPSLYPTTSHTSHASISSTGRRTPSGSERATMEIAALEIARMAEEIEALRSALSLEQSLRQEEAQSRAEEMQARMELEAHLASAEDRLLEVEMEVREEVMGVMEERLEREMRSWKAGLQVEREMGDERVDWKVEVLARGMGEALGFGHEGTEVDGVDAVERARLEDVELENDRLKHEVEALKRTLQGRSPSKKTASAAASTGPLREARNGELVPVQVKKMRKLTARKWDFADEAELS